MSRPNILFMIPHDLGDTLHCYGHRAVRSPNLDRLAAEGVRCANCFTTAAECTPSRGGLYSGMQGHRNGLVGLANWGWELCVPHLAQRLAEAGYATHLFGTQHETAGPTTGLGYQEHHGADSRRVGDVCTALADWLATAPDGPWFANAGFFDVHRRWPDQDRFGPDDVEVPGYLPDLPEIRNDLADFYGDIETMDTAIGRVLEALAAAGLAENTMVLFTTDHGAGFPRAKATMYDPGLHVPLIMRLPGVAEGGRVVDGLLSNLDVTPTLLELAGAPVPDDLDGRSFLSLLRGGEYVPRDAVEGSVFYDVAYDPIHYVRTHTHKYIRSFAVTPEDAAGANPEVLPTFVGGQWVRLDDHDVLSSPSWKAMASPQPKPPREELYDLVADPLEQRNLVGDPAAAGELAAMRGRLAAMMVRTGSPLLTGHIPPCPRQLASHSQYRPGGPMYTGEGAG